MKEKKSPCQRGRHGEGLWLIQLWLVMRLVLFSLAAGDDDRGSAQDEHDASHVEDRGTDAAGGGQDITFVVSNLGGQFSSIIVQIGGVRIRALKANIGFVILCGDIQHSSRRSQVVASIGSLGFNQLILLILIETTDDDSTICIGNKGNTIFAGHSRTIETGTRNNRQVNPIVTILNLKFELSTPQIGDISSAFFRQSVCGIVNVSSSTVILHSAASVELILFLIGYRIMSIVVLDRDFILTASISNSIRIYLGTVKQIESVSIKVAYNVSIGKLDLESNRAVRIIFRINSRISHGMIIRSGNCIPSSGIKLNNEVSVIGQTSSHLINDSQRFVCISGNGNCYLIVNGLANFDGQRSIINPSAIGFLLLLIYSIYVRVKRGGSRN